MTQKEIDKLKKEIDKLKKGIYNFLSMNLEWNKIAWYEDLKKLIKKYEL